MRFVHVILLFVLRICCLVYYFVQSCVSSVFVQEHIMHYFLINIFKSVITVSSLFKLTKVGIV